MNNIDINKLLSTISKMDKSELEKNIKKAQEILDKTDLKTTLNKDKDNG